MSTWSLTCQQSVFKRYHSDKHFSEFYLQDGGKNQLADTEQYYVTVTLLLLIYSWRGGMQVRARRWRARAASTVPRTRTACRTASAVAPTAHRPRRPTWSVAATDRPTRACVPSNATPASPVDRYDSPTAAAADVRRRSVLPSLVYTAPDLQMLISLR